jgi:hypothetical protein
MTSMKTIAAALGATAMGVALSAPVWAQAVGSGQSGPTTMERPSSANTRDADKNFGGAKAPSSTTSSSTAGAGAAGCDKLTGKNKDDCMARRDAAPVSDARKTDRTDRKVQSNKDRPAKGAMRGNTGNPPLAGESPGVGVGGSGPVTMERPATANTRDANASAGGAKAPDGAASNARRGPSDKPVR